MGYLPEMCEILEKKGFDYADSCVAIAVDHQGKFLNECINPMAPRRVGTIEAITGRMATIKINGFLFKQTKRHTGAWVLGNQIMKDICFWRIRTDQNTGQYRPDHGYVYEIYRRIIARQPSNPD